MESEECKSCPLYEHRTSHRLPPGAELAWKLHRRLGGPAVQRYGLQELALQTVTMDLDQEEMARLLDQLDAIVAGLEEAGKELAKPKAKAKGVN